MSVPVYGAHTDSMRVQRCILSLRDKDGLIKGWVIWTEERKAKAGA